jgi:hypothetical protein
VNTRADGGRPDAAVETTAEASSGVDASASSDAEVDADADAFIGPAPCSWTRRDGGPYVSDGAVLTEPDGIAPSADAGTAYPPEGPSYPEDYCRAACNQTFGYPGVCKPAPDGQLWCLACLGRRPEGFTVVARIDSNVGRTFAEMARLEAASIVAFRTLARELAFHRAPRRLVRAAERAARDEIRHARAMTALARRHGAVVSVDEIATPAMRDLETIARENAIEGCVHETWGALLAHHQAMTADDPTVRAVMARIARDETQHAALGWQIAAWAKGRLDRDARDRVARAMRDASDRLVRPATGEHQRMLRRLDAELWSRAA